MRGEVGERTVRGEVGERRVRGEVGEGEFERGGVRGEG